MFEYNNYRRNLVVAREKNFFVLPWASLVIKNCKSDGEFLSFKTIKEYKDQRKSLWLLLQLNFFRDNLGLYTVLVCSECDSMQCVGNFSLDQPRNDLARLKCVHSKAAEYLLGDFNDHWTIPPPDDQDQTYRIRTNVDMPSQSLIDEVSENFLGAYQLDCRVSVLYTVSRKQKVPFCSSCKSQKCKCFFHYKKVMREEDEEDED